MRSRRCSRIASESRGCRSASLSQDWFVTERSSRKGEQFRIAPGGGSIDRHGLLEAEAINIIAARQQRNESPGATTEVLADQCALRLTAVEHDAVDLEFREPCRRQLRGRVDADD